MSARDLEGRYAPAPGPEVHYHFEALDVAILGGDCDDCRAELAEAWCRRCPKAAAERIGDEHYCAEHALMERWKANAPAWNSRR